jgi:ligand-binding sensor domain-containing protein
MRLFILFLLLFSSVAAHASGSTVRFERLSLEDGLSQSSVYQILQDRKGFLWFATQDGLNRYDGYQFKVYRHNPQNSGSLSDNFIQAVFLDADGVIWVGTKGGGLNRFDESTDSFENYIHEEFDPHSLGHSDVRAITQDSQQRLWVGTREGLNQYDLKTGRFKRFLAFFKPAKVFFGSALMVVD